MRKKILIISIFQVLIFSLAFAAEDVLPNSFLSFNEAEDLAIKNSHLIASQKYTVDAAAAKAFSQQVKILPNFSFDASSMFMSKIGRITIPQLGLNREVGDHLNWSAGPTLNWVVWDTWQIINQAKSLRKITDSESDNLEYDRRQVLLNARVTYISVQFALAQVILVRDALQLARAQYGVVFQKKEVGTADLLDLTVAHQEVVDREKDLEQAEGDLAIAKRGLVAALGFDPETAACDSLDVEHISKVLNVLLPKANAYVDIEAHPQVQALANKEQSSDLAAKSSIARYYPEINLQGRSTFEYPNLGEDNTIQQNKLTVGLSVPILDWGMISKETKSYKYQARSAGEQKKQTMIDLSRRTSETRERIQTLKDLRVANARAVRDAVEVAQLSYDSYMAGRIIFLDVQRANVKALSAKVSATQNDANLAIQISSLLALAESEGGAR